jgi:ABC-type uncharacterized transport system substrate-binding protein
VTLGTLAPLAAKRATATIPIVMIAAGDPVGSGLIASLARPGGNVTGFYPMQAELCGKRVEILRTAFPDISTLAVLENSSNIHAPINLRATEEAAWSLGLMTVTPVSAGTVQALAALRPTSFADLSAVVVLPDAMFWNHRGEILALVDKARLPAIYPEREYAEDGGLMAYGANIPDNTRRAADYVDRILKGAKPGELPIQQSTKFDFVVNLRAARALGFTIPSSVLDRADEVIE